MKAIQGHILAKAVYGGLFRRIFSMIRGNINKAL
jgi:hypothetical protein